MLPVFWKMERIPEKNLEKRKRRYMQVNALNVHEEIIRCGTWRLFLCLSQTGVVAVRWHCLAGLSTSSRAVLLFLANPQPPVLARKNFLVHGAWGTLPCCTEFTVIQVLYPEPNTQWLRKVFLKLSCQLQSWWRKLSKESILQMNANFFRNLSFRNWLLNLVTFQWWVLETFPNLIGKTFLCVTVRKSDRRCPLQKKRPVLTAQNTEIRLLGQNTLKAIFGGPVQICCLCAQKTRAGHPKSA